MPWPRERAVVEPAGRMPELVARRMVRAMAAGRHEIVVNLRGRLLILLNRLCPALVDRLLARYG